MVFNSYINFLLPNTYLCCFSKQDSSVIIAGGSNPNALESHFHTCLPAINVWISAANQGNTPYFKLVNSIMIVSAVINLVKNVLVMETLPVLLVMNIAYW